MKIPARAKGVASAGLLLAAMAWCGLKLVPIPAALHRPPEPSLEIVDRHGATLREARVEDRFAKPLRFAEIPPRLVRAMLAAEDKRFFAHHGVDWLAVGRAARDAVRHRRIVSGASTITQQLVKVAAPRPRTVRTKLIEGVTALRLEQLWSKERILEEYMNRVEFGHLNVGIAAAANYYFRKPLSDLSDAEAAFLAGLPKNPRRLNPHRSLRAAQRRQQTVLRRMHENGWLSRAEVERATAEAPRLQPVERTFRAPHFVDLVFREAPSGSERKIRTTVDLRLNERIEQLVRTHLGRLKSQHALNGAAVVLENATGDVLALVGSEDYFAPGAGQVNGTWAPRAAGSTIKPFTYLLALDRDMTPATILADVPARFVTPTGIYQPENYARHCAGPVRLRMALANSLNLPAVQTLASLGGAPVLHRQLTRLGLTTLTKPAAEYGLGLTIGNAEVRLIELTNAYACLARLGEFKPWRLRASRSAEIPSRALFDPGAAWLIADILSDNAARTRSFGAHSPLRFDYPVACKTGTSTDFRDNWAIGYTPEFTVGVWVGNFDGSAMRGVSGVSGAAPILHDVFVHLHDRFGLTWYPAPSDLLERDVHPLTGKVLNSPRDGEVREKFLAARLPLAESPGDYDEQGRVQLGEEYAEWFASAENGLGDRAIVRESGKLRVVAPMPGTTFILDPDLPTTHQVRLIAAGSASAQWQSDSLRCEGGVAFLTEGEHHLSVVDPATGARAQTWIRVKTL